MAVKLSSLERIERTLNFQDVDFVATGEIVQNSRLVEAWHEHGIKVIYHSEGNLKKVMQDLVACGIDGINPLEPENISLEYTRKNYPGLVLWGGLDDKNLLPFGTEEQVEEAVKTAIEVCSQGRLILGSSGEIHPEVKPENAVALFRAAKKYGSMNSG